MKLTQKELYLLELEKEEFVFLLEVIDKIQLDPKNSSASARDLCRRFKEFRSSLVEPMPSVVSTVNCDGCDTVADVRIQPCPITGADTPLCPACITTRQGYKSKNAK